MVLGTLGSTLNDELNRLANGGTYRDSSAMVDEALAAKQWANRENITPYSTDTVGVLNEIAGLGLDKKNWLDFNGVCNYIAGTSGLPAAAALRQIYPTTDLLTGVAGYYIDATDASASGQTITNLGNAGSLLPTTVGSSTSADSNDAKFLAHDGTNYVWTPGTVINNNLTIPDSAALDITGDIDIRAYVALDDWTPATTQQILTKDDLTGALARTQASYNFGVNANGTLIFQWFTAGTTASRIIVNSTVAPTVADGAPLWVRVTLDVDNGASGNTVTFYTSTNGTSWTQLGTAVTTAGVTSIYAGTTDVRIGQVGTYGSELLTGKTFRAQIYSDITGTTKVLDVDTSVITAGSATSFTAVTGQTVTINRSTSGRKTVAVTQPTWLFGTDDYMEVNNRYMAHTGSNYLYLPGVASNFASTPDSAALDITGDIDLRVKVALDDWTPAAQQVLMTKQQSGTQRSYALRVSTAGLLEILWSVDGSTLIASASTVATGLADGATKWVRATLDVNNGASGNTATFFLSDDGITWTQLGATVVTAGVTSIYSSTSVLEIGGRFLGANDTARGKFFRAQVLNGIGGTVAFDANFEGSITSLNQASFTESSSNAATVTINRSGSTFRSAGVIDAGYLYPGATNTFSNSTTDFLNFGATDSFTALIVSRQANYTATQILMNKGLGLSSPGYFLRNATGTPANLATGFNDATVQVAINPSGARSNLGLVSGALIRNVATDTGVTYTNATAGPTTTDSTTGSLATVTSLFIGSTGTIGNYVDMELYAVAVFRQALTATQIRQISNYFANREAYL